MIGQEKDAISVPDLMEPVYAWRCWMLSAGVLRSTTIDAPWIPGRKMHATCAHSMLAGFVPPVARSARGESYDARGHHRAPKQNCTCGIYAANRQLAGEVAAARFVGHDITAIGIVALWGKIIPHTKGYRAEYAYPNRLWVLRKPGIRGRVWAGDLSKTYGVPVKFVRSFGEVPHAEAAELAIKKEVTA